MKKIIIVYKDEETGTSDEIARELPGWREYNFCKGILIDLFVLMNRNILIPEWMIKQFKAMNLLDN